MSTAVTRDQTALVQGGRAGGNGLQEQKRSFLRMASHELRTPLNSILGFSEILSSQLYGPLGDERYREYADVIRGSGVKLLKLVNQLVDMARLECGETTCERAPEAVEPLVRDLLEDAAGEIATRDLQVQTTGLADAVAIADERALRSALSALVTNAVVFSPAGGVIRITATVQAGELEIVVANDGEGFDPADLPRLKRPFEQGENARALRYEGAGLGLAICDLACRAMSGRLELVSARGQGFSAKVVLPAN